MDSNHSEGSFVGDSEMTLLMQTHDWSQTPLGSVAEWPSSLKIAVNICLNTCFPMVIWWGKDLVLLYNDAWRTLLGTQYPETLGQPGQEVYPEIWNVVGAQLHRVLETAEAVWADNVLLPINRYGYTEEAYFTYSHSPLFLETGKVGGIFTTVTETTRRVLSERRLKSLRELAAIAAESVEMIGQLVSATLANNPYDIPFALLYLIEPNEQARLVQTVRIVAGTPAYVERVDLTHSEMQPEMHSDQWKLRQVKATGNAEMIDQLSNRFGVLPGGAWDEPSQLAIVLPLAQTGQRGQLVGFLVLGISPRLEFDQEYRSFFDLIAHHVTTAMSSAQANALTEQERRAQQLTHCTNELQALFDLLPIGVAIADDAACRMIRVNAYLAELIRVPIDANASHSVPSAERPPYRLRRDGVELAVEDMPMQYAARHNTQIRDEVLDLVHPDGKVIKLLCYCSPLLDEQNQVRGVLAGFIDITRRIQNEAALRESEERLKLALQTGKLGSWQLDLTTNELESSDQCKANFGLAPEAELSYQRLFELIHLDDRAHVRESIERSITERIDYDTEYRTIWLDGSIHWITARGQAIYTADNAPIRMMGVTLDITERKQAEAALRRSEERLRVSQELSLDAFTILDSVRAATGQIIDFEWMYVNPKAAEILKRPVEELVGQRLLEVLPGNQLNSELFQRYVRVVETGEPHDIELFYNEDGITGWFRNMTVKIDDGIAVFFSDITDRKQVEAARLRLAEEREQLLQTLAEERAQFEAVLRQMPEGVLIAETDSGQLVLSNEQANQILRHTYPNHEEEHESSVPFQAYRMNGQPYAAEEYPLVRSLRTGEIISHEEMEIRFQDDSRIYIDTNSSPVFNNQGDMISAVTVFQDITQRKQIEQALRDAEERLRVALQNAPIIVFNQDHELKYTWIYNPVLYDVQEMLGKHDRDYLPPEDAEPLTAIKQQVLDTGIGAREEIKITRGATNCYYDLTVEPLRDADNAIIGITCAAIDISELKRTEIELRESKERLRLATEAADIYSWEIDLATQIATVSDNFTTVTGCPFSDFPMTADNAMIKFVHSDDIPFLSAAIAKAIETDGKLRIEYRFLYPETEEILWVESIGSVLRDNHGTPVQMIGITQNVTSRKQAEAEREQLLAREQAAREAAEAANRIKDEFLAVVSHELRSPLNPILGWAKLLRTGQLNTLKTERALEVIERNAQMQAQLINDLLDVSRVLRGKLSLDTRPVDLASAIQSAIETVRLAAEAKSIQIHTQFEPEIGQVAGDAGRLQQVVWNLLSNAVKFTPEGGRVEVRLEQVGNQEILNRSPLPTPHSPPYAQITVTDTGKGIPADFLPYVFDHFRQESSATTRRFGGLGLGLAIVRYLVELHGGTVQATSLGEGQGATFTVKLPLLQTEARQAAEEELDSALDSHSFASTLNNIRILVVDDDDNTREFLAFLLELHGANVLAVASADEAIITLSQFQPDVLVSDIGMPDVDGYMLMQQIRALAPEQGGTIPAIALTAYAGEFDQQQALAAGFQRHISKPVEPEILIRAIIDLR